LRHATRPVRDTGAVPTPPPPLRVLDPWTTIGTSPALAEELAREVPAGHPLHGVPATPLARRMDNDDVLFALDGGPAPFVVVHLTWSRKPEAPGWPRFEGYASLVDWRLDRMDPDRDAWLDG